MSLISKSPKQFVQFLKDQGIHRFYIATVNGKVVASHSQLNEIAQYFQNDKVNYDKHEGLFFQVDKKTDILFSANVHKSKRGQAQGGTRFWTYNTVLDFFNDGIRLSKGMSHKSGLAGLWWGGGKGVISHNEALDKNDAALRKHVFNEYGSFVTSLRGAYVTAEDVGCGSKDMGQIFETTRFVTCIPQETGGSGNPSRTTAQGVVTGMQAALFHSKDSLKGKVVACQGLGNVGSHIVDYLVAAGVKKVIAWDINGSNVEAARKQFAGKPVEVSQVDKEGDLKNFSTPCDIFAPNAVGAIINDRTIPLIKAKIICGASNNQLENPVTHDLELVKRGILYMPDFLVNRMGIVRCADEQAGYVNNDEFINRHFSPDFKYSIHNTIQEILNIAKNQGRPTHSIALELAEKCTEEINPIYGHRAQKIINSLIEDKWHTL